MARRAWAMLSKLFATACIASVLLADAILHAQGNPQKQEEIDSFLDGEGAKVEVWKIQMPKEDVPKADMYRCTAKKLPGDLGSIVKMQAFPSSIKGVHHAMLFMCEGVDHSVLDKVAAGKSFPCYAGPQEFCTGHASQIYGYDNMNAIDVLDHKSHFSTSPLAFPDGVGVIVGQKTTLRYALLQVHNNRPIHGEDTHFDLTVKMGVTEPNRVMITQMLPGSFEIPPGKESYKVSVPTQTYHGKAPLHLWGVHSHFHMIGTAVHFEVKRAGKRVLDYNYHKGKDKSTTVQKPAFEIRTGDTLSGYCTYDSRKRSKWTYSGMSHDGEEMCNIGLMIYAKCDNEKLCASISRSIPGGMHF